MTSVPNHHLLRNRAPARFSSKPPTGSGAVPTNAPAQQPELARLSQASYRAPAGRQLDQFHARGRRRCSLRRIRPPSARPAASPQFSAAKWPPPGVSAPKLRPRSTNLSRRPCRGDQTWLRTGNGHCNSHALALPTTAAHGPRRRQLHVRMLVLHPVPRRRQRGRLEARLRRRRNTPRSPSMWGTHPPSSARPPRRPSPPAPPT